jgi:nuclear transcription factor Y gamma
MDQSEQTQQQQSQQQQQQPVMGVAASAGQVAYASTPYQTAPMVASGTPSIAIPSQTQPPATFCNSPHQLTYQQAQHFHHQQQQQQLQMFWTNQMHEIEQTTDFKNHSLPLARIKKIMKADEDVRMISAEAPVIFAKACEMFILELTLRSWIHTEENKRRTLQKNDIAAAISRTDVFDFLVDIIPRDELKEEGLGVTKSTIPVVGSPADLPYYYVPQHPVGPPGMIMGNPVDQAATYGAQQPRPPMAFMPWPQPQPQQPQQRQSDT